MTVETPGSQSALREANQRRVIHAVRAAGALTQAEIARTTGLSAATVSNIVRELRDIGTVMVTQVSSSGRRAQSVSLAKATGLLLGVEISPSWLRAVLCDHDHRVIAEESIDYDAAQSVDRGLRRTEWLVTTLLRQARVDRHSVRGVGVSLPGPVDATSGQLFAPASLPTWQDADIAYDLSDRIGLPVFVDNDANAAALGELVWGAGQGVSDLVYVKLSMSVSAALVLRGGLYPGAAGLAGQIGHITVDEQGRICRCGNRGCLETYIGGPALLEALATSHGAMGLRDVINRALDGDPGCRRVLHDAGRHLGVALAGLVNLVNPEVIVVGGQLAKVGHIITDPLQAALERCAIPSAAASVRIRLGVLDAHADVIGALAVAEERHAEAEGLAVSVR